MAFRQRGRNRVETVAGPNGTRQPPNIGGFRLWRPAATFYRSRSIVKPHIHQKPSFPLEIHPLFIHTEFVPTGDALAFPLSYFALARKRQSESRCWRSLFLMARSRWLATSRTRRCLMLMPFPGLSDRAAPGAGDLAPGNSHCCAYGRTADVALRSSFACFAAAFALVISAAKQDEERRSFVPNSNAQCGKIGQPPP